MLDPDAGTRSDFRQGFIMYMYKIPLSFGAGIL